MEVEIVKADSKEIIPGNEMSGFQLAVRDLDEAGKEIEQLKQEALATPDVIETKEQYKAAAEILTKARNKKTLGSLKMKPFLTIIEQVAEYVRAFRDRHEIACKEVEAVISPKLVDFDRREKQAAQAEENRKNEERRQKAKAEADALKAAETLRIENEKKLREKAVDKQVAAGDLGKRAAAKLKDQIAADAEQLKQVVVADAEKVATDVKEVKVVADIPKVSGLYRTVKWFWKVIDITKIPREKLYPNKKEDGTYDVAKFPAITQFVNEAKDKAKAEAAIPGIEVWSEDKV